AGGDRWREPGDVGVGCDEVDFGQTERLEERNVARRPRLRRGLLCERGRGCADEEDRDQNQRCYPGKHAHSLSTLAPTKVPPKLPNPKIGRAMPSRSANHCAGTVPPNSATTRGVA